MSVRIRLARGGAKHRPVHKIVVADKRCRRDGRFIEELGLYNPLLPKDSKDALHVDVEKAKAWLAKGAEPTERIQKLFALLGICEKPAIKETPKKSAPKAKAQERIKAAEEAKLAAEEAAKAEAEAAKAAEEAAKAEAEAAAAPAAEQPAAPAEETTAQEAAPAEEATTQEKAAE